MQTALDKMKAAGMPMPDVERQANRSVRNGRRRKVRGGDVRLEDGPADSRGCARDASARFSQRRSTMTGDSCVTTDQYQQYAEVVNKGANAMMTAMGFDKIAPGRHRAAADAAMSGIEMRIGGHADRRRGRVPSMRSRFPPTTRKCRCQVAGEVALKPTNSR